MRTLGVDVSHWEGSIDWKLAAPTIGFAYYKCTDGVRYVDQQFYSNRQGCQKASLASAPYHYYQPALDPLAQAEHFIRSAGKTYKQYIVDIELPERHENIAQKILAFLHRVEQLTAIKPAIYTSAGYWNEFIQPYPQWTEKYELVVAHYTLGKAPLLPTGWTNWRIWQFSDDWCFRGCNQRTDANWFNGSFEECQTWFGNTLSLNPQSHELSLRLRSLFDNLHIRQSPSMKAKIIGNLSRGEVVQAEELSGDDVWVRHDRGWSSIERGGYRYMEILK